MTITLIAAVSENGVIGNELNELPWEPIIEDLRYFRDVTSGHTIVMGSKTFESLGSKPLPNRTNIVFTRRRKADYPSPTKSLKYYSREEDFLNDFSDSKDEIFIIGGSHIFSMFIPIADFLLITEVHKPYIGNIKFPSFNKKDWIRNELDEGEQNGVKYTFVEYFRKEVK